MTDRKERCETCAHYMHSVCFRYPPQVFARFIEDRGDWDYREARPSVSPHDWCGEWKAKDEAP